MQNIPFAFRQINKQNSELKEIFLQIRDITCSRRIAAWADLNELISICWPNNEEIRCICAKTANHRQNNMVLSKTEIELPLMVRRQRSINVHLTDYFL